MIPRLHKRGNSFKGALGYVLHDPGKATSERVGWVMTQNIYAPAEHAWFEMFDTYRNRTALKANAGVDPRGRDNKNPVLHFTLAWALSETPERDHMEAMARDALKALGLAEHEAVIACHTDKEHHHVHVVVNTVHPYTGKTAPMKFSKLEFSKWAEAYEREHGIHCEQRIKNNEQRREIAKQRETEREHAALAILLGRQPAESAPFEPVNDNSLHRRRWFERKEIIDRMKALRAALDQDQKLERGQAWAGQVRERDQLERDTQQTLDRARGAVRTEFKGKWSDLYRAQKSESRELADMATHPFERAVFVFRNRERLGDAGKPLTLRRMIPLILSGRKLAKKVLQLQDRERRALARTEKTTAKHITEDLWKVHREKFNAMRDRQAADRAAQKAHQITARRDITFARAKDELSREADAAVAKQAPVRTPSERQPDRALEGVPVAPKQLPDAHAILIPDQALGSVPRAPQAMKGKVMTPDASSLLKGQAVAAKDVPAVPQRTAGNARQGVPARPQRKQLMQPFREAVKPGTPNLDDAFRKAAAPQPQPKAQEKDSGVSERVRKEFERWSRDQRRDNFERDL